MTHTDNETDTKGEKKWYAFEVACGLRRETPEFRRCCLCVPLRRGLIGWGYIKLALNTWTVGWMAFISMYYLKDVTDMPIMEMVLLLIDAAFSVFFILGGHQKNIKFLKIAYIYSFIWLGLALLSLCWLTIRDLGVAVQFFKEHEHYVYILPHLLSGFCVICSIFFVQIYWILLVRSLLAKLRNQPLEFQFTNCSAAEADSSQHDLSVPLADATVQSDQNSKTSDDCTAEICT